MIVGLSFHGKLIIDMKYRTLQDAYNGIYRPRPKFNDYFPPESRLIILERKSPEEEEQQQKSVKLYNDIAAASDGLLRADQKPTSNTLAYYKRKGARLALTDLGKQQTPESYNFDFLKQIADNIGATIDDTIGVPATRQERFARKTGKEVSLSSKFTTYYITRDNVTLPVVLCVSFNKGIDFEETLFANFQEQLNDELQAGGLLEQVLSKIGIANQYKNLIIDRDPGKSEKRQMGYTEDQVKDVGKEIGDFTITNTKNKKEYYISLKNQNGKTFANKGVSGIFKETVKTDPITQKDKYTVTPGSNTILNDFFQSITGDEDYIKDRICQGLEEYANGMTDSAAGTKTKYYFENIAITPTFKKVVQTAIKSGLGYGYYYLKMKSKTEYVFIDLTTREKLDKFVNENIQIQNINMQFPYYVGADKSQSSKAFKMQISTKNGSVYEIAIRTKNANKFVPSEFIISVNKFEANPQNKKDMILTVIPPALAARAASKPAKKK
jgi:hypothetical protein